MPKIEIDYSNTIIYKISCKDVSCHELYVGYTTNFVQRKHAHKQNCNNDTSPHHNMKLYKVIRENGGWDNWNMEMIDCIICNDIDEAKLKEYEYSKLLHATLNAVKPIPKMALEKTKTKQVYYCESCKIYTSSNELLEQHKQTKKHEKMTNYDKMINDTISKFYCEVCDFKCGKQCDYNRHLDTKKHKNLIAVEKNTKKTPKNADKEGFTCLCGSFYPHLPSLQKHQQTCDSYTESNVVNNTTYDCDFKSMFLEMVKQNEEFKQIMVEQNTKLMEMANNQSITNNNNNINYNNNNTINNKFNLQIFLNETCKDAMNIQEFIDYVKVQHSDFENFGKYGYVEALTRIFLRNLMELDVCRRPIHCSDSKREVLYVKDNDVWVSDVSREKLIRTIKYIANKNVKQIPGWMDKNPDSKNTQTKLHDKYMRMLCFSMGAKTEEEDQEYYKKIIRNVAKEVCIDKAL